MLFPQRLFRNVNHFVQYISIIGNFLLHVFFSYRIFNMHIMEIWTYMIYINDAQLFVTFQRKSTKTQFWSDVTKISWTHKPCYVRGGGEPVQELQGTIKYFRQNYAPFSFQNFQSESSNWQPRIGTLVLVFSV